MRRYTKLFIHFFRNCLIRELEFRFNVLLWSVNGIFWFFALLLTVKLFFGQVKAIGGWSQDQVLILVCVFALFQDLLWTFVYVNLLKFSDFIRTGYLDYILLKPVSSRFMVSVRYFEADHYLRIIIIFFMLNKFLADLAIYPGFFQWLVFFITLILGLIIIHSIFFIISTTAFWFINIFNLLDLFQKLVDAGRSPISIYQGLAAAFFLYVVPVGYVATFPTQALLGSLSLDRFILGLFFAAFFAVLSQIFWNFALTKYSSASS